MKEPGLRRAGMSWGPLISLRFKDMEIRRLGRSERHRAGGRIDVEGAEIDEWMWRSGGNVEEARWSDGSSRVDLITA